MAENSAISWTDHTFNPWIGCARISPACDGCYAAGQMGMEGGRFPKRADWGGPGKGEGTRSRTAPSTWAKVRTWDRQAEALAHNHRIIGEPEPATFVFCASLADVFDNAVPPEWRRDLFDLIRATPNLTWLLLTKRPGMIVKLFREVEGLDPHQSPSSEDAFWPRNAAIGCTVVNQEEADRDIPKLLAAKAALNPAFAFLSMEPLLGPVDLRPWLPSTLLPAGEPERLPRLDWVITGGETDQMTEEGMHHARPANPAWFRSLRDQCAAAGVPFHFKQNGEHVPLRELSPEVLVATQRCEETPVGLNGEAVRRVGKDRDPCTLDGVTHDARPEVATHA